MPAALGTFLLGQGTRVHRHSFSLYRGTDSSKEKCHDSKLHGVGGSKKKEILWARPQKFPWPSCGAGSGAGSGHRNKGEAFLSRAQSSFLQPLCWRLCFPSLSRVSRQGEKQLRAPGVHRLLGQFWGCTEGAWLAQGGGRSDKQTC